mmetsp:Transcript_8299/g.1097  ORF Transcript_8299/g.1097 Transcript_8299/m.1097 type:complete len:117 (-) Transcript_8299:287-637(-)
MILSVTTQQGAFLTVISLLVNVSSTLVWRVELYWISVRIISIYCVKVLSVGLLIRKLYVLINLPLQGNFLCSVVKTVIAVLIKILMGIVCVGIIRKGQRIVKLMEGTLLAKIIYKC